jgi:hypothetical protein
MGHHLVGISMMIDVGYNELLFGIYMDGCHGYYSRDDGWVKL